MGNATSAVCENKIQRLWPIYVGIDGAQNTCYWRKTPQLLRFGGKSGAPRARNGAVPPDKERSQSHPEFSELKSICTKFHHTKEE